MIIVFGSINIEIDMHMQAHEKGVQHAGTHRMKPGGHGLYQALAAARMGVKTALITKVGGDDYTREILEKIRFEGVTTSGTGHSDLPTGVLILANGKAAIISLSANLEADPGQVPDEILNKDTIVLIQDEFSEEKNLKLLEHAKSKGARTILTAAAPPPESLLKFLDYVVVHVGTDVPNFDGKVIMLREHGCSVDGHNHDVHKHMDHRIAPDIFSGVFAAGLHAGLELERALTRACVAAALSKERQDQEIPLAYVDDIDEAEKEV